MTDSAPVSSLCMIVRNSASTLPACMASIRPWVDEIVAVDTGSSDDTIDIARSFGARIFEFPWIDDFATARNESLRHARGQWLFWMDSDDTIDAANGAALRSLAHGPHAQNVLGYVIQVHCPAVGGNGDGDATVVDHVKLVRNDPRIRFEGRIHEQILPSIRRLGGEVGWTDLFVVHSGADQSPEGRRKKHERDLRILQLDLQERPDHPFVLFNLGMTYADMDRHEEAEAWLRRCLDASQPGESHVRKAFALLASCLQHRGQHAAARDVCRQGLDHFPDDPELAFRRGMLAHEEGQWDEAISAYRSAMQPRGKRHFTSIDRGITGSKSRHNLALVHADKGDHPQSELHWRLVLQDEPANRAALRGLGQSLLAQNKLSTLDRLLAVQNGDAQADVRWLRALAAEKAGDTATAGALLDEALRLEPEHLPARRDLCRWLFHFGSPESAVTALEELVSKAPDDAAALHNLGVAQARVGKVRQAVECLERSLQLRPDSELTREELARLREVHPSILSAEPDGPLAELPPCHSRRPMAGRAGEFHCLHPQVHARDQVATPEVCGLCNHWRQPPPARFRDLSADGRPRQASCAHLGPETGLRACTDCPGKVQIKVYQCRHPRHAETTLAECEACLDYNARLPVVAATSNAERAVSSATSPAPPLDIVYLFRHSAEQDLEIRFSLRSVAQNLPFVRKVWIFGDRPEFLTEDTSLVEHVPHEWLAPLFGYSVPVRNEFLLLFLASLIPELAFDFLRFSDDYIVLSPLLREQACTVRALEDLTQLTVRGRGVWKDQLWRTYDVLQACDFPGYNFSCHVPQPLNRGLVLEAFRAFRNFVTEDRYFGLVTDAAIFNYAVKHRGLKFVWIGEENSKAGFYGQTPSLSDIRTACSNRWFLNFDDRAFGGPLQEFLSQRFPDPCRYEKF